VKALMSAGNNQGQQVPILVLREGTTEQKDKDAKRNNITAAKVVAELVKTSLGPRGMDKMLVNSIGDVTITNDGATILKEIDVEHPAAKMMVEVAKSVDNEVGDGTTSSVVLAGALIEKAEELINKEVHATVIVDGYQEASEKALDILKQDIAIKSNAEDKELLNKIAFTSMASKLVANDAQILSNIVVDAVLSIAEELKEDGANKIKIDIDNIKVEKKAGASIHDTQLIHGIILDKEVVHGAMPKKIDGAKIALLNCPLEIEKTEMSAEIRINQPQQMQRFLDEENRMLRSMVDKIKSSGANVVLCQKGIDDLAQHHLAKEGIVAVRRIKESDMTKLSKATGAKIITNIDELSGSDLGSADLVEERKVETDKWVFVEGCKNPNALSILVRGGSQKIVDEAERSIHDAIMAVKDVVEYPYVIVGGGASEIAISQKIREWSGSLSSREQLAAEKFADALESIPLVLAENAGMDIIDTQVQLRAKSSSTGKVRYGVDVLEGKVADLTSENVYEPLLVKEQIIKSAVETASMILRIDNVIAASKSKGAGASPRPGAGAGGGYSGGGAGGYGGYEDME
jgi:archaeal chaperonin